MVAVMEESGLNIGEKEMDLRLPHERGCDFIVENHPAVVKMRKNEKLNLAMKNWYHKNKEKQVNYMRQRRASNPQIGEQNKIMTRLWRRRNKAKHNNYQKVYRGAHMEHYKEYFAKYYVDNPESKTWYQNWTPEQKEELRQYKKRIKLECFRAYGDGNYVCACCGLSNVEFLTLDHTNNDGYLDKKEGAKKRMGGNYLYGYLKKRGFPNKDKYQVLCWNCNCGKGINGGVCPHKTVNA